MTIAHIARRIFLRDADDPDLQNFWIAQAKAIQADLRASESTETPQITVTTSTIERWRGSAALPGLLLALTAITGLVDAVSYLKLGNVFVANMTGNVEFLGFGLTQKTSISATASLVAIATFLLGALGGGRVARHHGAHRGRHQAIAATIGLAGFLVALLICLRWGYEAPGPRYLLIATLAGALGLQNATARALAVPDLTTTVLTLTLTGLAADSRIAAARPSRPWRRLASVLVMLVGALVGALLVLNVSVTAALGLACLLQAAVATAGTVLSAGSAPAQWAPTASTA